MKGTTSWNYSPYKPLNERDRALAPYITRIAPKTGGFSFDYIDNGSDESHTLKLIKSGSQVEVDIPIGAGGADIDGLIDLCDYEFRVVRSDGTSSDTRLVRTGEVCGTVINYLHPDDKTYAFSGNYLCSPAIVRLPSGRLLSSMDVFAGNAPQNLTLIYSSDDDGKTWQWLTELMPCFWGRMFVVGESVYMLGVSDEYGDLLIGRSDDDGRTWTNPTVLFRGSSSTNEAGCHRAPMRICRHNGRIWTDLQYGGWLHGRFDDAVVSAPEDCDLLDPANWTCSGFFNYKSYFEGDESAVKSYGGIEGNVVVSPDGELHDVLRFGDGKILILKCSVDDPEAVPTFEGVYDIPITASKFDIEYDETSGYYWMLASRMLDEPRTRRNLLSLLRSKDIKSWEVRADIIDGRNDDPDFIAYQYVTFIIEGEDIIFQSRTAYNGAHNFHDANFATFHRINGFRELNDVK